MGSTLLSEDAFVLILPLLSSFKFSSGLNLLSFLSSSLSFLPYFFRSFFRPFFLSFVLIHLHHTTPHHTGLLAAGETLDSKESNSLRLAEQFLLSKQRKNGGWGESALSCLNRAYQPDGTGKVSTECSSCVWCVALFGSMLCMHPLM